MTLERHDYYNHLQSLQDNCKNHMFYHVTLTMTDGSTFDGIIDNVGADRFSVLVGEDVMDREDENQSDERQYFPYGPPPRRRFRRFRRREFPFASLAALALLPYVLPPVYPPYPYPYPYPYY